MRRFFSQKQIPAQASEELQKAYQELDTTARTLIRTDLQLRRSNECLDRQILLLHALHRVGQMITSSFDSEIILNAITESMVRDLDFEKSGILVLDKNGHKAIQSAYSGFSAKEFLYFLDHMGSIMAHPTLLQEDVFVQNRKLASGEWREFLEKMSMESMVLLPVRIKSRLIGLIVGGHVSGNLRLDQNDRSFYSMYASQVSTAIENARLYEALGQSNITLEEKVKERTKDLVDANERLKDLDNEKSNFISLVSHELRTPLTSIKGFIATLLHYDKEVAADKRKMYLSILNEETDRLTRLITELLDISKIESGGQDVAWKKTRLADVVQRVFDAIVLKDKTVRLVKDFLEDFPVLHADPDKMEQILMNLIGNAARFAPPNSDIAVRGRRYGDGVIVEVRDQGPGIPFGHLERIFDKFYRMDNDVNRKNPGTGLGLPICRGLVNLHGGKIWAESEVGHGSCFIFTLPLNVDKPLRESSELPPLMRTT